MPLRSRFNILPRVCTWTVSGERRLDRGRWNWRDRRIHVVRRSWHTARVRTITRTTPGASQGRGCTRIPPDAIAATAVPLHSRPDLLYHDSSRLTTSLGRVLRCRGAACGPPLRLALTQESRIGWKYLLHNWPSPANLAVARRRAQSPTAAHSSGTATQFFPPAPRS